jgi:putative ABC transport system permease protein
VPLTAKSQLNQLVKEFPNITIIEAADLLQQVIQIINQAINALQYTFFLVLFAGIIILWASMETTLVSRKENYRIMRILGASSNYVRKSLLTEFLIIGLLAGLMGAFIANLISIVMAYGLFHIDYHFSPYPWLLGAGIGLTFVSVPALWFLHHLTKAPPLWRE